MLKLSWLPKRIKPHCMIFQTDISDKNEIDVIQENLEYTTYEEWYTNP